MSLILTKWVCATCGCAAMHRTPRASQRVNVGHRGRRVRTRVWAMVERTMSTSSTHTHQQHIASWAGGYQHGTGSPSQWTAGRRLQERRTMLTSSFLYSSCCFIEVSTYPSSGETAKASKTARKLDKKLLEKDKCKGIRYATIATISPLKQRYS